MTIKLDPQTESYLIGSIRQFFTEELDDDIGELKARAVLEFCVREIAPSVYNQAIADAQTSLESAVADLSGSRYEPEFDYWKTHPSTTTDERGSHG
jgi:uncharacterized protein (DUF2164 family)